jgi:hypothetical protein
MSNSDENDVKPGDDEPRNLWEEFGLPPPRYEDERHAPPVDRGALQALVDKRLPEEEIRELYRLTFRFRSWAQALAELDAASLRRAQKGANGPKA